MIVRQEFNPLLQIDRSLLILNAPVLQGIFSHCYANEKSGHVWSFVLSFLHEK